MNKEMNSTTVVRVLQPGLVTQNQEPKCIGEQGGATNINGDRKGWYLEIFNIQSHTVNSKKQKVTYAGVEPAISRFVVWRLVQFGQ